MSQKERKKVAKNVITVKIKTKHYFGTAEANNDMKKFFVNNLAIASFTFRCDKRRGKIENYDQKMPHGCRLSRSFTHHRLFLSPRESESE